MKTLTSSGTGGAPGGLGVPAASAAGLGASVAASAMWTSSAAADCLGRTVRRRTAGLDARASDLASSSSASDDMVMRSPSSST